MNKNSASSASVANQISAEFDENLDQISHMEPQISPSSGVKKRKKPLLSDDVKKINHIKSENKRRNMMKEKHLKLIGIVPKLNLSHPSYDEVMRRITTGGSSVVKKEYDDDDDTGVGSDDGHEDDHEEEDSKKQIEKLKQEIHSQRSIYKLSREHLQQQYTYNSQLKEYIQEMLASKQLSDDSGVEELLRRIRSDP